MATHRPQAKCGFSLYRGVLVQWDEDHDLRVLELLDQLPACDLNRLLVIQEHEGSVAFLWHSLPVNYQRYQEGCQIDMLGDLWTISSSASVAD